MSNEINAINNIGEAEAIIAEEEAKMQTAYTEIGKLYFQRHSDDCEEEFKPLIDALVASSATVTECNERIEYLNSVPTCPKCSASVKEGSIFCTACGTRLIEEAPVEEKLTCPRCGNAVKEGMRFCTSCGNRLIPEEKPAEPDYAMPAPSVICPMCGRVSEPGVRFCVGCGTRLFDDPAPTPLENATRRCHNCGHISANPAMPFCTECGTRLN